MARQDAPPNQVTDAGMGVTGPVPPSLRPEERAPFDCQICGACCFSGTERYVRVTGDDYTRLGEHAERFVHFIGNQAFMRMEGSHCSALSVNPRTLEFSCVVYAARPTICRELGAGSAACRAERSAKADLVLVALRRPQTRAGE